MAADPHKVFVIHGRNEAARRGVFEFLRAIGLQPIEWEQAIEIAGGGSPYIGQVLDAVFDEAQAVVVLQTPDDVGYLHDSLGRPGGDPDCEPQPQPRQNVTFEAGMAMGRAQDRTILVGFGELRAFSDIHGRHEVRLDNTPERRQALATRLKSAGCAVETSGTDWLSAGDLTPPAAPGHGLPLGKRMPSSEVSRTLRFSAALQDRGASKMSPLRLTNLGPGIAREVNVRLPDEYTGLALRVDVDDDLPIPRLPVGATVTVMRLMPPSLADRHVSYFDVIVTATTEDGTPVEETLFVSRD